MSTREFDNYLVLLGRFLGLSGPQREAIAGELADHFEERLAELESRGVDHDRAVRIAVEEFGDAAGLASRFLSLSRNTRRRWIMRCTAFSLAGALTALVLVTAFWPQDTPGPTTRAAAQNQPGGAGGAGSGAPGGGGGVLAPTTIEENNAATEAKLAERMPAEFMEVPLADVLQFISEAKEIEIYVDKAALTDEGVAAADVPVSINLKKVRGDMLLDLVLKQAGGLTYVVRDGIVVVSTTSALEEATEVRVYNCRDLLALSQFGPGAMSGGFSGGLGQPDPAPGFGGGIGGGTPFPGGPQPGGLPPGSGGFGPMGPGAAPGGFAPPTPGGELPGAPGAFPSSPGGSGPGAVPPMPGVGLPPGAFPPVPGEPPAPGAGSPDSGGGSAAPAPSNPNRPLPQVFDSSGGGAGGGFIGGGGLGGAAGPGGVGAGMPGLPGMPAGMMMPGGYMPNTPAEKLIAIIEGSVFTQTWENIGGFGTIREYGGLLVINNNVRVHRQVEKLLDMLREAALKQPGAMVGGPLALIDGR